MKSTLEIDSVQISFRNRLVLSDVYLKCETGEIIGLLGRNGSGKSTLLKIIFGLVEPDYKFLRVDGIKKNTTEKLFTQISYLSQENFLPAYMSVKNVIALTIEKCEIEKFYEDELIHSIRDKKIGNLSGGELRYLEINLILSNSTKFALLDEPYNGLSPLMIENVNRLIRHKSNSKGIIITDHNFENVINVSQRLILLVDGKTQPISNRQELVEKGYLLA